jgi:hypothetical protein
MKKSLLKEIGLIAALAIFAACSKETNETIAQDDESKIAVSEELSTIETNPGFKSAFAFNICCNIPAANIVRDPEFLGLVPGNLYGAMPCNNIKNFVMAGRNLDWFAANHGGNSPQYGVINCSSLAPAMGACNRGYVHFWGNRQVGESITQDNQAILQNRLYIVQFNARIRPSNIGATRLALRLSQAVPNVNIRTAPAGAIYSPNTFTSTVITDTAWRCYKFTFTDSSNSYKVLNLFPVNQFSGAANFGRLDIDDVKIW